MPRRRTTRPWPRTGSARSRTPRRPGGTAARPAAASAARGARSTPTADPNATGRDFGNWFPARLTLEKVVEPAGDPGRFDLLLAADGVRRRGRRRQCTRSASRRAPTTCRSGRRPARTGAPTRRASTAGATRRTGAGAGTARPIPARPRRGRPGDVHVPQPPQRDAAATRDRDPQDRPGDRRGRGHPRLHAVVTNPGGVAFAADAVEVTDPRCDDRPVLDSKKAGDSSPGTLDPGDTWRYRCSRQPKRAGGLRADAGRQHRDGQRRRRRDDRHRRGLDLHGPALPGRARRRRTRCRWTRPARSPRCRPSCPARSRRRGRGRRTRATARSPACCCARRPRVHRVADPPHDFRGTRIAGVRISVNGRPSAA